MAKPAINRALNDDKTGISTIVSFGQYKARAYDRAWANVINGTPTPITLRPRDGPTAFDARGGKKNKKFRSIFGVKRRAFEGQRKSASHREQTLDELVIATNSLQSPQIAPER